MAAKQLRSDEEARRTIPVPREYAGQSGYGGASRPPPSHTTVRSDHEYGGSADAVRVMCTPQPECRLPVRQPRVHPRCRTQAQHLAGCRLTAPPQVTTPLYRSGLQQKTLRLGLSVAPPFGAGVPH
jgi:hypothetical protein